MRYRLGLYAGVVGLTLLMAGCKTIKPDDDKDKDNDRFRVHNVTHSPNHFVAEIIKDPTPNSTDCIQNVSEVDGSGKILSGPAAMPWIKLDSNTDEGVTWIGRPPTNGFYPGVYFPPGTQYFPGTPFLQGLNYATSFPSGGPSGGPNLTASEFSSYPTGSTLNFPYSRIELPGVSHGPACTFPAQGMGVQVTK